MNRSRRNFMKKSAMAISSSAFLGLNNPLLAQEPIKWDEEWDVLIVGSGFAGSAATCQAIESGVKTLMIDKMPVLGGNSAINGGAFACVGSPQQKERGIEDSYDLYMKDILHAGLNLNDRALIEIIARNGLAAYNFCTERGVIFRNDLGHFGGHSVPRTVWPEINSGAKITLPLQKYAQQKNAVIRTKVILDDFIQDNTGRIIGAKVRENYEFNFNPLIDESENDTGTVKYYKVNGGIIMASGGFSYDIKFRSSIDPTLTADIGCTNHYGATAQPLKVMMKYNAKMVDLHWIQLGPWGSPDEEGFGIAPVVAIPALAYGVMVDARTGKRFISELTDRKRRADAIIAIHKNTDGTLTHPIVICDSVAVTGTTKANIERGIHKKVVRTFNTIEELAKFYNIPLDGLSQTITNYNRYVVQNKDEEFDKPFFKLHDMTMTISKPPFYAFRVIPKVHHTMGGVKIDTKARVINNNGEVIKGLFSCGEAVGGPHGASRLGSCAVSDCLVFGRIAAKSAIELIKS